MSESLSRTDRTKGAIDWPDHLDRTESLHRTRTSKFTVSFSDALEDIQAELLDRLGADGWRLSTAAPHRKRDGLPYADANPDDPGVVVRWTMDGNQYAVACDHYTDWRDNARAIGLYIEEKRKMDARPVETGQSEFATARLPPADDEEAVAPPAAQASDELDADPYEVLGVSKGAPEAVIRGAARQLKAEHHPDGGGDPEQFKRVVRAEREVLDK
jgi:hypothetical protein